jgi:hypothetical protein
MPRARHSARRGLQQRTAAVLLDLDVAEFIGMIDDVLFNPTSRVAGEALLQGNIRRREGLPEYPKENCTGGIDAMLPLVRQVIRPPGSSPGGATYAQSRGGRQGRRRSRFSRGHRHRWYYRVPVGADIVKRYKVTRTTIRHWAKNGLLDSSHWSASSPGATRRSSATPGTGAT